MNRKKKHKKRFLSLHFLYVDCRYIFIYLELYICIIVSFIRYVWLYSISFQLCSDVEENPGPKVKLYQSFSICHSNVNNVSTHNFIKILLSV